MKLNLAENIKRLRTQKKMTQEELADRVGFSHKAVSRWETGAAYPDIETLPVLADIFGVTLDELLGASEKRKKSELNGYYERLGNTGSDSESLEIIREMLEKYPHDTGVLASYQRILHRVHAPASEIRNATHRLLSYDDSHVSRGAKFEASARLYDAEDDDKAEAVLTDFPDNPLLDLRYLKMSRSLYRGDWEKYRQTREAYLLYGLGAFLLPDVLPAGGCVHSGSEADAKHTVSLEKARLKAINALTDTFGQKPVLGDKEPDLWFYYRINSGLRLSCALAGLGNTDESLSVLEDVAELFEGFWTMPEGTELSFRTEALPTVRLTPVFFATSFNGSFSSSGEKYNACCLDGFGGTVGKASRTSLDIFFSADIMPNVLFAYSFLAFDREDGWEWFDVLRGDERYKSCVARMKKFVMYKK